MISYNLAYSLKEFLFSEGGNIFPVFSPVVFYADNNVCSKFLEVTVIKNKPCFIPICNLAEALRTIAKCPHPSLVISYPLFRKASVCKRTGDSILNTITRCHYKTRFMEITTPKGLTIYGGSGAIFDKNWNPLLLCGYNITAKNNKVYVENPICYVSPKVFSCNDIVAKAIINKVIPFITSNCLNISSSLYINECELTNYINDRVEVVVKDLQNFIVTPTTSSDFEHLDDSIWDFLNEHKDELK